MQQLKLIFDDYIEENNRVDFRSQNVLEKIDFSRLNSFSNSTFSALTKTEKKNNGEFYTKNIDILSELSSNIVFNNIEFSLVDPSCGEGDILIYFIKKLLNEYMHKVDDEILLQKIINNFYGFDINPNSCLMTKYNIYNTLIKYFDIDLLAKFDFNKLNIFCFDFSLKNNIQQYQDKFDFVIGNPPYITYYGKHSKPLTQVMKKYYIQNYNFIANKKIDNRLNSSMFFIENAIEILKEKGIFSYILDISFFEPPYKPIRDYINYFHVQKLVNNIKGFDLVYSGQLIISVEKSKNTNKYTFWKDFETKEIIKIKSTNFNFIKPADKYDNNLIQKIDTISKKFNSFFGYKEIRTCAVLTGRTNDFVFSKKNQNSKNNFYPFLEGSKGLPERFIINIPSSRFLEYDYDKQLKISDEFKIELEKKGIKNKKRIGLGNEQAYRLPKIFIRQSAKKIISAYSEEYLCSNNSIYIAYKKNVSEDTKLTLKYICCLLNSEILTFYALKKNIIRVEKGKIPQIRLSDLYTLPLIIPNTMHMNKIIDYGFNNKQFDEMNLYIAEMFGIINSELEYMKQFNFSIEEGLSK